MGGKKSLKRKGVRPPVLPTKVPRQLPSPPYKSSSPSLSVSLNSDSESYRSQDSLNIHSMPSPSPPTITATANPPTIRPPPIILNSSAWRGIAPMVYNSPELNPTSLSAKTNGLNISIHASDIKTFRTVQHTLLDNGTEFHTFSLPEERSLKVVLKGIPLDITNDELKSELERQNFSIKYIRRFGSPNKILPLCLVHVAANPVAKEIFQLTNLLYVSVTVEPYKSSGPAQCFSCQRFGHGSRNCG